MSPVARRKRRAIPKAHFSRTRRSRRRRAFWSQATVSPVSLEVERGRMKKRAKTCSARSPTRKRQDRKPTPVFADERFFAVRDLARLGARPRGARSSFASTTRATTTTSSRATPIAWPRRSTRRRRRATRRKTTRARASSSTSSKASRCITATRTRRGSSTRTSILRCATFPRPTRSSGAFLEVVRAACAMPSRRLWSERSRNARSPRGRALRRGRPERRRCWRFGRARPASRRRRARSRRSGLRRDLAQAWPCSTTKRAAFVSPSARSPTCSGASRTTGGVRPCRRRERAIRSRRSADDVARRSTACAARSTISSKLRAPADKIAPLRKELAELEGRFRSRAPSAVAEAALAQAAGGNDLPDLLRNDATQGNALAPEARRTFVASSRPPRTALAKDALQAPRFAPVALASSCSPRADRVRARQEARTRSGDRGDQRRLSCRTTRLDSLDAARYLRDNEEYWPFEGDDWPDEFVGSRRTSLRSRERYVTVGTAPTRIPVIAKRVLSSRATDSVVFRSCAPSALYPAGRGALGERALAGSGEGARQEQAPTAAEAAPGSNVPASTVRAAAERRSMSSPRPSPAAPRRPRDWLVDADRRRRQARRSRPKIPDALRAQPPEVAEGASIATSRRSSSSAARPSACSPRSSPRRRARRREMPEAMLRLGELRRELEREQFVDRFKAGRRSPSIQRGPAAGPNFQPSRDLFARVAEGLPVVLASTTSRSTSTASSPTSKASRTRRSGALRPRS